MRRPRSLARLAAGFPRSPRRPSFFRPRVEALEDRWVPTTWHVHNLNDVGFGSLRDTLQTYAQSGDTVDFDPGLSGTINMFSGQMIVTKNVTIHGPDAGAGVITINANQASRIFKIGTPLSVSITNLTLSNGNAASDTFFPAGGAILNVGGTVTLTNVNLTNNRAPTPIIDPNFPDGGGAVFNTYFSPMFPGVMTLTNCVVTGNTGNADFGGGLYNDALGCRMTLNNTFVGNNSGTDVTGGGIYNLGTLTLTQSTVANNVTSVVHNPGVGAGIYNQGTLTLTQSTVSGNVGPSNGGGIYTTGAGSRLTVTNSTVAFNKATNSDGGGIWNNGSAVTLTFATVASNNAARGGGIFLTQGSVPQVILQNTLVANDTASVNGPDIFGNVNQANNDLIGNGTGSAGIVDGVNGNMVGTQNSPINPFLGTLQFNGGPTATMALLVGSRAIDAGSNTGAPPTDQRGLHRIVNGTADIGAYEFQPPSTTTMLVSSLNPSVLGDSVTFTATVSADAPGSNVPPGSVNFMDGAAVLGTRTLANGVATFTTTALGLGVHPITAVYTGFTLGDYHYSGSTSNQVNQNVRASTTTSLAATPNPSNHLTPVTFTATISHTLGSATPTGTVDFLDNGNLLGTANVVGAQAMLVYSNLGPGVHPITAVYSGDANYGPSPSNTVNQSVGPTTTSLQSDRNPSNVNDPVTFTATVTPVVSGGQVPGGTVTFFADGSLLATVNMVGNTASYQTSALGPGSHQVTAHYDGDPNYAGSNSNVLTQLVGITNTALQSSPNPSLVGQQVTFTATVTPLVSGGAPVSGSVSFFDNGALVADVALTGNTATYQTSTLTAGNHPFTARYDGDPNYAPSLSDVVTQVVGPNSTTLLINPTTSTVNQSVAFTATVTPIGTSTTPTGTVTLYDGANPFATGTLTGGTVTINYAALPAGTHNNITAHYSGDSNFAPSVSSMHTLVVNPAATSTALMVNPSPATANQPVTFTATVTTALSAPLAPGGSVVFFDNGYPLVAVPLTNGHASYTLPGGLHDGTRTVTATYTGDPNFVGSSASQRVTTHAISFFAIGGSNGRVQVYTLGNALIADFAPFGPSNLPINVAVGDILGDGYADIVVAAGAGNPDVRVYRGRDFALNTFNSNNPDASLIADFFPYAINFNVGANVAVGDINNDGFADIVTGATIGNPDVRVYNGRDIAAHTFDPNGASLLAEWFPYGLGYNIGANVAVGDVNGDGYADVVTGATAGNPDVRVYNGRDIAAHTFDPNGASLLAQWFAYGLNFNVGAFVAVGETTGDGYADVITGASAGNPDVHVYDGRAIANHTFDPNGTGLLDQFFAYDLNGSNTGVTVGAADYENNLHYDIITGATSGPPHYRVLRANSSGVNPPALFEGFPGSLVAGIAVGAGGP